MSEFERGYQAAIEAATKILSDAKPPWNQGGALIQELEYQLFDLLQPPACLALGHSSRPGGFCSDCVPLWVRRSREARAAVKP
jgi:hypothetical protein